MLRNFIGLAQPAPPKHTAEGAQCGTVSFVELQTLRDDLEAAPSPAPCRLSKHPDGNLMVEFRTFSLASCHTTWPRYSRVCTLPPLLHLLEGVVVPRDRAPIPGGGNDGKSKDPGREGSGGGAGAYQSCEGEDGEDPSPGGSDGANQSPVGGDDSFAIGTSPAVSEPPPNNR